MIGPTEKQQRCLNFIKDFNKTVKDPKKINSAMLSAIGEGIQGKLLEDIDVNVQLSVDYNIPYGTKHMGGGNISINNTIGTRYYWPGASSPKMIFTGKSGNEILDIYTFSSSSVWSNVDYNKTFSLKKNQHYTILWEVRNTTSFQGPIVWFKYKNLNFNLFVSENDYNKIKVYNNTWDITKLFSEHTKNLAINNSFNENLGSYPLVRTTNDMGTKTYINKIKL